MYANQMKSELQMRGKKLNKSNIMKELAEKLYISEDAVKSWMYGNNGPSDLEQVKLVADYFGVEYHQLLDKEGLPWDFLTEKIFDIHKTVCRGCDTIHLRLFYMLRKG